MGAQAPSVRDDLRGRPRCRVPVGTLVLGDTMRAGFDDIFTEANEGTDAIVRNETEIGEEMTTQRGYVDADLATTIRDIDGVAAAEPAIQGFAQIIDKDGDPIGGNGPPTLAGSWIDDPTFNPWAISEGRAPESSGEVVIDQRTADDEDFAVGDPVTVNTPTPVDATIVGFATFGELDSLAGATFTAFTYEDAQQLFVPDPSKASSILVAAAPGVSQEQLVADLDPVLPDGVEALTGTAQTAEDNEDINDDFIGFFETFLLVFAVIGLLVATFSIYNTFSIIIAQRTRESALLRAIGASRRQILTAIGLEAVMIGIIASIVGLISGIASRPGCKQCSTRWGSGAGRTIERQGWNRPVVVRSRDARHTYGDHVPRDPRVASRPSRHCATCRSTAPTHRRRGWCSARSAPSSASSSSSPPRSAAPTCGRGPRGAAYDRRRRRTRAGGRAPSRGSSSWDHRCPGSARSQGALARESAIRRPAPPAATT